MRDPYIVFYFEGCYWVALMILSESSINRRGVLSLYAGNSEQLSRKSSEQLPVNYEQLPDKSEQLPANNALKIVRDKLSDRKALQEEFQVINW